MSRAVYIASSYDVNSPLSKVFSEGEGVVNIVNQMSEWKCLHVHQASRENIFNYFSDNKDLCYQVFHFAGHALDKELQLNEGGSFVETAKIKLTYNLGVGAIASTINAKKTIQLVILNGCSTVKQVETFKKAGVPAVIYTNQALNDDLGSLFAKVFYKSFFEHRNTLVDAFNYAVNEVKTDASKAPNGGVDPVTLARVERCIVSFKQDLPSKELYELDASDEMKQMRWENWHNPASTPLPSPIADPLDVARMSIPSEVVHRCDRRDEASKYYKLLEQLATQGQSGPFFFFVHEKSEANPFSLVQRFELYGKKELCKRNKEFEKVKLDWKYLKLPDLEEMTQPGVFRSRLFEIYDELFKYYKDKDDFHFHRSEHGEKVFVIYHNLMDLELEAGEAPNLSDFLTYYLEDFSEKISSGLKAKIAVVFYCVYREGRTDYVELFDKVVKEPKYCDRVRNLTGMKGVSLDHIINWRDIAFEGRLNPKPPDENELFFYPATEVKPMADVQAFLLKKINDYNEKIKSSNG